MGNIEICIEFVPGIRKGSGTCFVTGLVGPIVQFFVKADDKAACDGVSLMLGVRPTYEEVLGKRCLVLGANSLVQRSIGDLKEAVRLNDGRISRQIVEDVRAKYNMPSDNA